MTDEQIIEALECHISDTDDDSCRPCVFNGYGCLGGLIPAVADLINRQKAEIERLNVELQAMRGAAKTYRVGGEGANKFPYEIQVEVSKKVENEIKSEAVKEFAELLRGYLRLNLPARTSVVTAVDIDKLVKRMTEVQE